MLARLFIRPFFVVVLSGLFSCDGKEEKTTTDTVTSDTSTTMSAPEPSAASSIVTTPQHMVLVRYKVSSYAKWKATYHERDSMRLANGLHNYVIGQSPTDSNMIFVAVKADDMAKAKAFAKSSTLKQAMQKGAVTGTPTFTFATMVFQDTSMLNTPLRSMTTFPVKSWSAWQSAFEEGKQERIDNGITVRAYGHDPDDSNKVVLVTAIIDTAKASAYWTSDMLKKRRTASGVTAQPQRSLFNVVQRF